MMQIFEAQRLISLRSIFDLADNLEKLAKGEKLDPALVEQVRLAVAEIQLPALVFECGGEEHADVRLLDREAH